MKTFFNLLTVLIGYAGQMQYACAQEYLNPVKNLSVTLTADTLYFKDLDSNRLVLSTAIKKGSASHYLKFSPSGNFMVTSGDGPLTSIYSIGRNEVKLISSVPVQTGESVFDGMENTLFLLQTTSAGKKNISSYTINPWKKLATAVIPSGAHGLTINASGRLIAFGDDTNIHTRHSSGLMNDKVFWKGQPQRLLAFNPAVENQLAGVNTANHIQIFDVQKDSMLMEINKHMSEISWIGFDPSGKLLSSLDQEGYLFTWLPSKKQCIAELEGLGGIPIFGPDGTLNISSKSADVIPGFIHRKKKILAP
ncbi:WD40 repeat domain-containing protein [Pedobacter mucosus]|uniref:WD40 repeat domain-containing protein n=1 Tax=Pedobacter mucosus TaxID=2895286 RepID=UPI001EE47849|nr:WD40 repeat domain-containing protein [Pedobacter mucosus]UKT65005.1 WD40 repeat domain-containing protein [Pedobacter mucosus]